MHRGMHVQGGGHLGVYLPCLCIYGLFKYQSTIDKLCKPLTMPLTNSGNLNDSKLQVFAKTENNQ